MAINGTGGFSLGRIVVWPRSLLTLIRDSGGSWSATVAMATVPSMELKATVEPSPLKRRSAIADGRCQLRARRSNKVRFCIVCWFTLFLPSVFVRRCGKSAIDVLDVAFGRDDALLARHACLHDRCRTLLCLMQIPHQLRAGAISADFQPQAQHIHLDTGAFLVEPERLGSERRDVGDECQGRASSAS
ncbi:hypothetical protein AJ88_31670 [Mesorhizobium amorphae CCBAU 01583]|nr:hypothetical protein AJ88_31670 [Mesorhizobium amorphae CCBAU 01583]